MILSTPRALFPSRIYGSPKMHKVKGNISIPPLRPIVLSQLQSGETPVQDRITLDFNNSLRKGFLLNGGRTQTAETRSR